MDERLDRATWSGLEACADFAGLIAESQTVADVLRVQQRIAELTAKVEHLERLALAKADGLCAAKAAELEQVS